MIFLDKLMIWLKRGEFKNRSVAFKEAVILMIKRRFQDRRTLREELSRSMMRKDLRTAETIFTEIRREEDEDIS